MIKIIPSENLSSHFVKGYALCPPFPADTQTAIFALGCFWGAERCFWQQAEVYLTAVGYAGGTTADPSYQAVCGGNTGHTESVLVVYHESQDTDTHNANVNVYEKLLKTFWEAHDPTQGMRQGNDIGSQYRSAIFCFDDSQYQLALKTRDIYQTRLNQSGYGEITTELIRTANFYYAEDYHQQYLAKNPGGYCGLGGTGIHL